MRGGQHNTESGHPKMPGGILQKAEIAEISDTMTLKKPVIGMFSINREKVSKYIGGKLKYATGDRSSKYNNLEDFTAEIDEFSKTVHQNNKI